MPVFWRQSVKGQWPVLVYIDPYSFSEAADAMTEIFAHPIAAPPFRLLVDRRHCTAADPDFIHRSVSLFAHHRDRLHGSQIAIVVGRSDVAYGMARMTELTAGSQGLPAAVQVFRDWNAAERWLASADGAANPNGLSQV